MAFLTSTILTLFLLNQRSFASPDVGLTPGEMITNHDYPLETHEVTTEDGYILTLYRIPHGIDDDGTTQRPAVLLMHGFAACSAEFVATGPGQGLAYILADAGYDVWLVNARGTQHSRKHVSIDINVEPEKYFNFTWHEIGYYDVASSVDYILQENGDESLYYVGHPQGTTVFLVLVSTRPEYNGKIRLGSLMAPAAIVKHYPNVFIQEICKIVDQLWVLLQAFQIYEIPFVSVFREIITMQCFDYPNNYTSLICDLATIAYPNLDKEVVPVILSNCPANAGVKQYVHYGQLVRDGGFRQWDYGTEGNLEVYGTETSPDYDLAQISTPVAFFYAQNDQLIALEDENTLVSMVPNVAVNYLVPDEAFGHGDFATNPNVVELVYHKLLSVMDEY